MVDLSDLIREWLEQADAYERDDARVPAATLLRRVADDLNERLNRRVGILEASRVSNGYTPAHLRELCRQNKIEGAQKDGADWSIPIGSVPVKPGRNGDGVAEKLARIK
jgi:hypothetical protein